MIIIVYGYVIVSSMVNVCNWMLGKNIFIVIDMFIDVIIVDVLK